jgi:uncharacterized protein (TIGR02452 family)
MDNIFTKRVECWNDTLNISNNQLCFPPPSSKYKFDNNFVLKKICEKTNIKFFNMDAIDCCLKHSPNALVLNLADDCFPGGCVGQGSGAQEESLFRRTNYCKSLNIAFYPLKNDEIIYSPGVSVIKSNEHTGWKLLDSKKLHEIAFIACPGIRNPNTIDVSGEKRLQESDVVILKRKIKTIIQIAVKFKYETVILGALGCGAWGNPSKHVAEIFKDILREYDGTMLNFYFAIMTTSKDNYIIRNHTEGKQKTVDVFQDVFE